MFLKHTLDIKIYTNSHYTSQHVYKTKMLEHLGNALAIDSTIRRPMLTLILEHINTKWLSNQPFVSRELRIWNSVGDDFTY